MNSIEITDSLLAEVEKLAAAAYSPKQVAFMLGYKPSEFSALVLDEDHAISIAYYKGFYSSELSIRESILLLARSGSSPAQASSLELFKHARKELIKGQYPGITEDE
jgi:hypothetical protein